MRPLLRAGLVAGALSTLLLGACEAYDPCSDKDCGELCTVCDPDESECEETAVTKVCNRNGVCTSAQPTVCN